MVKNNYVYPACIKREAGEEILTFPDFPDLIVAGEDMESIIEYAQEVLALAILDYIDQKKELPVSSKVEKDVMYVHVWLPYYRNIAKEVYVKKTVTIPQWLDILAKENKVNFSAAMVRGIKEELGI